LQSAITNDYFLKSGSSINFFLEVKISTLCLWLVEKSDISPRVKAEAETETGSKEQLLKVTPT
jgi:hypothetical protein